MKKHRKEAIRVAGRGFRKRILVAMAAWLLIGNCPAQGEELELPTLGGWIAYTHTRWDLPMLPEIGPRAELYVIHADGSRKTPVTRNPRNPDSDTTCFWPMWSPDGKRLAYHLTTVQKQGGQCCIKIVAADDYATPIQDVAGYGRGWSPDGQGFLFSKERNPHDLYVLNPDTGDVKNLTESIPGERRFGYVTYTPDGRIVSVARLPSMSEQRQIFIMDPAVGNLRPLTDSRTSGPAADLNPHFGGTLLIQHKEGNAWPEDGYRLFRIAHQRPCVAGPPGGPDRRIAWEFTGRRGGKDIYSFACRIPARGENPQIQRKEAAYEGKQLVVFQDEVQRVSIIPADTDRWNGFAEHHIRTLSASRAYAVFALRHVNGHTLCKVDLQDGGYEALGPSNKDAITGAKISPDGKTVVFERYLQEDGRVEICVLGIDGSGLTVVEEDGAGPCWGPDGTHLVYVRTPPALHTSHEPSEEDLMSEMIISDLTGKEKRVLTRVPYNLFIHIAWSVSGTRGP